MEYVAHALCFMCLRVLEQGAHSLVITEHLRKVVTNKITIKYSENSEHPLPQVSYLPTPRTSV